MSSKKALLALPAAAVVVAACSLPALASYGYGYGSGIPAVSLPSPCTTTPVVTYPTSYSPLYTSPTVVQCPALYASNTCGARPYRDYLTRRPYRAGFPFFGRIFDMFHDDAVLVGPAGYNWY